MKHALCIRWNLEAMGAFQANIRLISTFGKFVGLRDGSRWKISVRFASLNSNLADVCRRLKKAMPGFAFAVGRAIKISARFASLNSHLVGDVGKPCLGNYRACSWWNLEAMEAFDSNLCLNNMFFRLDMISNTPNKHKDRVVSRDTDNLHMTGRKEKRNSTETLTRPASDISRKYVL